MEDLIKAVSQTRFTETGILREKYVRSIESWISRPEIIIIKGIRRCGKSTILKQVASRLNTSFVYVNFDDYRLLAHLGTALLDGILRAHASCACFIFDEIQKVPDFESWLRTHYDIEKHRKFIISGSNISLSTPGLARTLTGRNITMEVHPLDYREYLTFCSGTLQGYLRFGGFPEIVLEPDEQKKRALLMQYFSDILLRDIFGKTDISATQQFRALAVYLVSNSGIKVSKNKLAKELGIDPKTAEKFLSYLVDSYLMFEVPFFSYSAKTKYIAARTSKYYVQDPGLLTAFCVKENRGQQLETLVAIALHNQDAEGVYYWNGKKEVDFVAHNIAYQVSITTVDTSAFEEIKKEFRYIKQTHIITLQNVETFLMHTPA